jgi:hypothetical protein
MAFMLRCLPAQSFVVIRATRTISHNLQNRGFTTRELHILFLLFCSSLSYILLLDPPISLLTKDFSAIILHLYNMAYNSGFTIVGWWSQDLSTRLP